MEKAAILKKKQACPRFWKVERLLKPSLAYLATRCHHWFKQICSVSLQANSQFLVLRDIRWHLTCTVDETEAPVSSQLFTEEISFCFQNSLLVLPLFHGFLFKKKQTHQLSDALQASKPHLERKIVSEQLSLSWGSDPGNSVYSPFPFLKCHTLGYCQLNQIFTQDKEVKKNLPIEVQLECILFRLVTFKQYSQKVVHIYEIHK